jgi:hypothetical protein
MGYYRTEKLHEAQAHGLPGVLAEFLAHYQTMLSDDVRIAFCVGQNEGEESFIILRGNAPLSRSTMRVRPTTLKEAGIRNFRISLGAAFNEDHYIWPAAEEPFSDFRRNFEDSIVLQELAKLNLTPYDGGGPVW